ncbi:MAG: formate C-acetyltransferase [Bacilli bacterium]|nr:formate C-acetyltransferase [Bacilli bacterium]
MRKEWKEFKTGAWCNKVDVSNFIQLNYKKYDGDESFLQKTTVKTNKVWKKCSRLLKEELKKHVLDIDVTHMSGIDSFKPGYIDKNNEVIVGLQTDKPLKRMVNPYGGIRMVYQELEAYGYKLSPTVDKYFNEFRKSHNQGVFDVYDDSIKVARHVGLLTGLPDAYGRGRIIGDYRRVALYGIDFLIEEKKKDWNSLLGRMTEDLIRIREEVSMQIQALEKIKKMASRYGFNIGRPAKNAREAVQWLYFGYLAAVKENNGAAMSLGRVDAFIDIYVERDLKKKALTEKRAQELIDQFIIKLRLMRHLRTPDYDELFSGDPTWVTCSIGGLNKKGKSMVTKTSYRILNTLTNLDPAPEPNMTVLWSNKLPDTWKKYCARMSIDTDSIQYESDDLMRPIYGDDYTIACCVSAMREGKDMQFFGARCNLAKSLLYSINGGIDEVKNVKVLNNIPKMRDKVLDYKKVKKAYFKVLEDVADIYSNAMNIIHYMHDKYAYEAGQMALHDTDVHRYMAYGVAGLSVVADSLSAIKYAKVKPIRNKDGIAVDFEVVGDYPKYGNDDDRVDKIAKEVLRKIFGELKKHKCYRDAEPTMSVLTITSNVVYGSKTGSTPDGRKAGVPFAPGANPMHGRDENGAIASLNSVAKLEYANCCKDGISNTFSIVPTALGMDLDNQINNLVGLMDGYFLNGAHHLNVNVLRRETLIDAMENPEKYPLLTIRVSGYAVRFNRLTRKQQEEVISRTFHEKM